MINSIPRKSSSLILTKYIPKSQEFYNYKILILKRTSQGSFPNVFAFPGGNYDVTKDEKIINKSDNVNFPLENLKNTAFPLPPLAEQKRIVAKIDELMALCDRLESQIDQATAKQTALFDAVLAQV